MAKSATHWNDLEGWLHDAQEILNLSHWKVTVIRDAADVEAWADISPHSQAESADLRISHDFWNQTPEKQREILTHELLHIALARIDQAVEGLEASLGKIAWSVFEPQYEDISERAIDHLAIAIAPSMPIPEFRR